VENLPGNALAALEHARLRAALLNGDKSDAVAASWWRLPLTWNGELQRRTPFRRSSPQDSFFLSMEEEDEPEFCLMQENGVLKPADGFARSPYRWPMV
jgi:CRISPR-associated endonuclease/helicase Cas3